MSTPAGWAARGCYPLEALDVLEERGCQREGRGCSLDSPDKLCPTCSVLASIDAADRRLVDEAPAMYELLKQIVAADMFVPRGSPGGLRADALAILAAIEGRS